MRKTFMKAGHMFMQSACAEWYDLLYALQNQGSLQCQLFQSLSCIMMLSILTLVWQA